MNIFDVPQTVLQPSKIAGVGVFATQDHPKDTPLWFLQARTLRVLHKDLPKILEHNPGLDYWITRFCCSDSLGTYLPREGFELMHNVCYMNHSADPSYEYQKMGGASFGWPVALVDIVAFETELTHNYEAVKDRWTFTLVPERPR